MLHCSASVVWAPSATATAQASSTAARSRGSDRTSPMGFPVTDVRRASGACRASFSQSTSSSLPPSLRVHARPSERGGQDIAARR